MEIRIASTRAGRIIFEGQGMAMKVIYIDLYSSQIYR